MLTQAALCLDHSEAGPPSTAFSTAAHRDRIDNLLASLPAATADATLAWSWERAELLFPRVDMLTEELRAGVDRRAAADPAAARVASSYQKLAGCCEEYVRALSRRFGCRDVRALRAIAYAFHFLGESFKHAQRTPRLRWPYEGMHSMMKLAQASGHQSRTLCLDVASAGTVCSIDRLYMRALALAWAVQVGLTCPQLDVLDGWIWHWIQCLECSSENPAASALLADGAVPYGLGVARAQATGPGVFLPIRHLDAVLRMLRAELAAGRCVPDYGTDAVQLENQRGVLAALLAAIRRPIRSQAPGAMAAVA